MSKFETELSEPWFSLVANGTKVVEGRPVDGSFSAIKTGDSICFRPRALHEVHEAHEAAESGVYKINVRVTGVVIYLTVREMLAGEGLERCLPGIADIDEGIDVYEKFYSQEKLNQGILAIQIQLSSRSSLFPRKT